MVNIERNTNKLTTSSHLKRKFLIAVGKHYSQTRDQPFSSIT